MTLETNPIRPDIPATTHPDALAGYAATLDREGTIGRAAYHEARDTLGIVYRTLGAVADAEKAFLAHVNATTPALRRQKPDGRTEYLGQLRMQDGKPRVFSSHDEEFAEAAATALDRAAQVVDRRLASLNRSRDGLETRVAEALKDTAHPPAVHAEIRAHLKGLSDSKRVSWLMSAAKRGDKATMHAILSAPAFLSGLTEEQVALARNEAARAVAAQDFEQLQALQNVIAAVEQAGGKIVLRTGELARYRNGTGARVGRAVKGLKEVR